MLPQREKVRLGSDLERWVRTNTVHLRPTTWTTGLVRALHFKVRLRTVQPLILRFTPRGLQRRLLELTISSRSSFSTAAWAFRRWLGGREPRSAAVSGGPP